MQIEELPTGYRLPDSQPAPKEKPSSYFKGKHVSPYSFWSDWRVEQELGTFGITKFEGDGPPPPETWKLEMININEINLKMSYHNQARGECPLTDDHLAELHKVIERGGVLPVIVVAITPKGLLIQTGNHRVTLALLAGHKFLHVYVVHTTDAATLRELPVRLNQIGEMPPTKETLLGHAVNDVLVYGSTVAEAAAGWGLKSGEVEREVSLAKFNDYFPTIIPGANKLPDNLRKEIQDSVHALTLSVAEKLCAFVCETPGIRQADIIDYRTQYYNAKSGEAQDNLKDSMPEWFHARRAKKTGGGHKPEPSPNRKNRVFNQAKALRHIDSGTPEWSKPVGDFTGYSTVDQNKIKAFLIKVMTVCKIDPATLAVSLSDEDEGTGRKKRQQYATAAKASVR